MKYLIFAVTLTALVFSFSSCKKSNNNTIAVDSFNGNWELESVSGDMPLITYPAGNGNVFQFTEVDYKKYIAGNLNTSGHYTIVPDATVVETVGLNIQPGQFTNRIIFDNDTAAGKTFIDILDGKLRLVSGFFPTDGGSLRVYNKKQSQ